MSLIPLPPSLIYNTLPQQNIPYDIQAEFNNRKHNVEWYGAVGVGLPEHAEKNTVAILEAINALKYGGILYFPGQYYVDEDLIINNSKIVFLGRNKYLSKIKKLPTSAKFSSGIFRNLSDYTSFLNLGINGCMDENFTGGVGGISSDSKDGLVVKGCRIENTIGSSVILSATADLNNDFDISGNDFYNCGWSAIYGYAMRKGKIRRNNIERCGYTAIGHEGVVGDLDNTYCKDIEVAGNYINRAVSPSHILPAQVESGFMIFIGTGDKNINIHHNECIDNRNANEDGIGLGQDGVHLNDKIFITDNLVEYAGQFGIDATNGSIVRGNHVHFAKHYGISILTDLGGDASNIIIDGNYIYNNTTGLYGIYFATSVAGSNFKNIKIVNNEVLDDRGAGQIMEYGLGGNLTGLTVVDMEVSNNNFKNVKTESVVFFGGNSSGIRMFNNVLKTPVKYLTGNTPSVMGHDRFFYITQAGGPADVTNFVDGYTGQEMIIIATDGNSTIKNGATIKLNGAADFAMAANNTLTLVNIAGVWYETSRSTTA
jgi:hypothetical protein